jgi:hypothetical protein
MYLLTLSFGRASDREYTEELQKCGGRGSGEKCGRDSCRVAAFLKPQKCSLFEVVNVGCAFFVIFTLPTLLIVNHFKKKRSGNMASVWT